MYIFSKYKFKENMRMTDDELPDWVWRLHGKMACSIHGNPNKEYGIVDGLYHVSTKWCDII